LLAVFFLAVVLSLVFAVAEMAFRIARLWRRPPRWHAWALLAVSLACLYGVEQIVSALI
jgi:hypothetical protein